MEKNIGDKDKLIRVMAGAVIVTMYSQKLIENGIGYVGLGIALSLLLTALLRKSPLYEMFGINTNKKE